MSQKFFLLLSTFSTKKFYRNLRNIIRKLLSNILESWNSVKVFYVQKCGFWGPPRWCKNIIFKSLIKWPEIMIFGRYIAQNIRNFQKKPKIDVKNDVSYRKYENSTKKSPGVQNPAKYFLSLLVFLSFLVKI